MERNTEWLQEIGVTGWKRVTTWDIINAYHRLMLPAEDTRRVSTTFAGLRLRWRVQPQGAINSGANFQAASEAIIDVPEIMKYEPPLKVYTDDGANFKRSLVDLIIVDRHAMRVQDQDGSGIALDKLRFAKEETVYLGVVVTPRGCFTQPSTLAKALKMQEGELTTVTQLMHWCGVVQYLDTNFPGPIRKDLAIVRKSFRGKRKGQKVTLNAEMREAVRRIDTIATGGIRMSPFDRTPHSVPANRRLANRMGTLLFQPNVGIDHRRRSYTAAEGLRGSNTLELAAIEKCTSSQLELSKAQRRASDRLKVEHMVLP